MHTLAASTAAMAPLHLAGDDLETGIAALVIAAVLIWRTWVPRIRRLLFVIAGAALAAPLLGGYALRLTHMGPQWLPVWAFGLFALVFMVVELVPPETVRREFAGKVKSFHKAHWVRRGQTGELVTDGALFTSPLLVATLPGPLGRYAIEGLNLIATLPIAAIHSGLGVS